MATETVPETHIEERQRLAVEASWEIESIANVLLNKQSDFDAEELVVRALSLRLKDLAGVIMSALDDENDTVAAMRERLTGLRAEVQHG